MSKKHKITLKYGGDSTELLIDRELTIGKLLSFSQVQAKIGYDYHNVRPLLPNGVILDFETLIGGEDITLVLETRVNTKEGITSQRLVRGLSKLVDLQFKRHGSRHEIYTTADGVQIHIPRHRGDIPDGTLRSIVRDAMPGTSLSEFKRMI